MKYAILAAGEGRRLRPLTDQNPKALVPVAGKPLLYWQIEALERHGVDQSDIIVIGGYGFENLRRVVPKGVQVLYNPLWNSANNVLTVYFALLHYDDDLVVMNSDVIAEDRIFGLLRHAEYPYAVIDRTVNLSTEEMKVKLDASNRIVLFSKYLSPQEAVGEYMGFSFIPKAFRRNLLDIIVHMQSNGEAHKWYEDAFNYLCQQYPMDPVYCDNMLWTEIDTHEDLRKAEHIATMIGGN